MYSNSLSNSKVRHLFSFLEQTDKMVEMGRRWAVCMYNGLIYICKVTFVQTNLCADKLQLQSFSNTVGQVCI